jgi:hypothetical protein
VSHKLPGVCPREHDRKGLVASAGHVTAGTVKTLTAADLGGLGISAAIGRLEAGGARAPWVLREGAAQAVYVARGRARVQVSSAAGGETLLLNEEVPAGSVFVVPRFAVAFVAAGADGVEWVSLIKSGRYVYIVLHTREAELFGSLLTMLCCAVLCCGRPAVEQLTGKGSVLGGVSAEVLQASLNLAPELVMKLL